MREKKSKKGSFKGWRMEIWFKKNLGSMKTMIAITTGLVVYTLTTYAPTWANKGATAFAMIGSKLLLDIIDFYASDVKI